MKCPACGYLSLERKEACVRCGAAMAPVAAAQAQLALPLDAGDGHARPWLDGGGSAAAMAEPPVAPTGARGGKKRRRVSRAQVPPPADSRARPAGSPPAAVPEETLLVSDDDLDVQGASRHPDAPPECPPIAVVPLAKEDLPVHPVPFRPPSLPDLGEPDLPADGPPIIDRPEEIPAQFWAPEGAGLIRRAAALVVDLALLALLLGFFLGGGALVLWREGIAVISLLSGPGLQAALTPLALLAALLSFAYHVPCHAVAGATPGQRLAGLLVRSRDGSALTWGKAALRWCGAALGLACGGVGIAWALLEPRRRGWADLVSDTLIVARVPMGGCREPALTYPGGAGTMPRCTGPR